MILVYVLYIFENIFVESFPIWVSFQDFREACYIAEEPKDLVAPMNAFLDNSVVVPAHGWNKGNVVQMLDDIRMKMIQVDKQRKRKRQRGQLIYHSC